MPCPDRNLNVSEPTFTQHRSHRIRHFQSHFLELHERLLRIVRREAPIRQEYHKKILTRIDPQFGTSPAGVTVRGFRCAATVERDLLAAGRQGRVPAEYA